jgi:hypothetical protein
MRNKRNDAISPGKRRVVLTCAAAGFGLCAFTVLAADSSKKAPPPKFDAAVVGDTFFKDARLELKGSPPIPGEKQIQGPDGKTPPGDAPPSGGDGNEWSHLISSESLEAEVKAQPAEIDKAMKAPNPHKSARMVVTYLAAVYNVIFKYDKPDVRWKADSQALRDSFAKGGNNLKAWTDSQKKQVVKLNEDLKALIQGNPPALSTAFDAEAAWSEMVDRTPLMHRLEMGQDERLKVWTKDADAVKKNKDAIIREAEVIAMLARVIQDKTYDSSDDAEYVKFAKALEANALDAVAAAKADKGAECGSAVSKMQKACDECHGSFR